MRIGICSVQGLREDMEDAYAISTLPDTAKCRLAISVFDGHGGWYHAQQAARNLWPAFFESSGRLTPRLALKDAHLKVSQGLCDSGVSGGTCAASVYLKDDRLYVAHVGDCRVFLLRERSFLQLTTDHRVNDPREAKRILAAGGWIQDGYVRKGSGGLQPTRALGDYFFKDAGVIATPAIRERTLTKTDRALILATDGLERVPVKVVEQTARKFLRAHPRVLTHYLVHVALDEYQSTDNVTVVAVFF